MNKQETFELASQCYDAVFGVLDSEPDITSEGAGRIARLAQDVIEAELNSMFNVTLSTAHENPVEACRHVLRSLEVNLAKDCMPETKALLRATIKYATGEQV